LVIEVPEPDSDLIFSLVSSFGRDLFSWLAIHVIYDPVDPVDPGMVAQPVLKLGDILPIYFI